MVVEGEVPAEVVDLVVVMRADRDEHLEIGRPVTAPRVGVVDVAQVEPGRAPRPDTAAVHRP